MGVGRMPLGLGALAHPAGQRRGGRGDRPAARARAPADGEPRVRPAAARRRARRRALYGIRPLPLRRAPSSARCASGSRSSRWGRDEGRAHHADRGPAPGGLRRRDGPRPPRGLGDDPPPPGGRSPPAPLEKGSQLTQSLKLAGKKFKVRLDGWWRTSPASAWSGRAAGRSRSQRPGRVPLRRQRRRDATSPTSTSTTCRGAARPSGRARGLSRYPKGAGRFLAAPKAVSRVNC